MKAPGSPSSPLQTMYFFALFCLRAPSHLRPAGNPPPPRPDLQALQSQQSFPACPGRLPGVGRHLKEGLFKTGVTALGDVLLDVLGVRRAAVFQHHTVLLFIERDILLLRVRRAVEMVDQTVDDLAAEYGLL